MSCLRNSLSLLLLVVCCFCAYAQEPDTLANERLENSLIIERLEMPMIQANQGISGVVNVDKISTVPSFMGNSDPIRFVRLLPSVQLSTEIEGGLYMQGGESSMTMVSQQGVPVYGITHLLGLFSVFNTPHYRGIQYSTTSGQETRLAGLIDIQLQDTLARKFTGDVSLGLLSAQGTLSFPTGKKSALTVSARRTFINLVYSNLLKYEGKPLNYGFTDANITWLWKPTNRDRVWIDLFGCLDGGSVSAGLIEKIGAQWYNGLGAIHWNHYFPDVTLKQHLHFSTFGSKAEVRAFGAVGIMPSFIRDFGYNNTVSWKDWKFGAKISYYRIQPQNPTAEGHFSGRSNTGDVPIQNALETVVSAEYKRNLGYWMQLQAGVGAHWYLSPEKQSFFGVTPQIGLTANLQEKGKIELRYEIKRQNLFQLGLTNLGMPIEFWLAAGEMQAPQWSHNFTLSYNVEFGPDRAYALSSELYYRKLNNQLEYVGNIMDIYTGNYSLAGSVAQGKGRAYGVNFMLQKQAGKFTGWVSYAFSRSLRTFDKDQRQGEYPSSHERLHELDIVATYDFGRCDIGGSYIVATGAPYTPPKSIYRLGDRLLCEYGEYNSARLPYYSRLDVSFNWYFRKGPKGKTGLNVSIYNLLWKKNQLGLGMHVNRDLSSYSFRTSAMILTFLPALAFFHTF